MHIIHRKRTVKFLVLFLMMLTFAVIEDVLAAHMSGATLILETLPLIIAMSFAFTMITEFVEEKFEPGEQPLEHVLKIIMHLEKHDVPPTPEGIRKHLHDDAVQIVQVVERLKKKKVPLTYENIKRHLRADVNYMEYELGLRKRQGRLK